MSTSRETYHLISPKEFYKWLYRLYKKVRRCKKYGIKYYYTLTPSGKSYFLVLEGDFHTTIEVNLNMKPNRALMMEADIRHCQKSGIPVPLDKRSFLGVGLQDLESIREYLDKEINKKKGTVL